MAHAAAGGSSSGAAPQATTGPANSITDTNATVTGTVNPSGQATTVSFQYGTTTAYGSQSASQTVGAAPRNQAVSATLGGLLPGTLYHYRVIATNPSATTAGADETFTTTGTAATPAVARAQAVTGPALASADAAVLTGSVASPDEAASYYFEYGLSTDYGMQTSPDDAPRSAAPHPVSQTLEGLKSGEIYHYRLVAENSAGTFPGADRTFTTAVAGAGRRRPRALTLRVRVIPSRRGPLVLASGALKPPGPVTGPALCTGSVEVTVRSSAGRRRGRTALTRSCRYSARVGLRGVPRATRLSVSARFLGNRFLLPRAGRRLITRS
ncbi:MAG: hypothetical protein E6G56_12935 [Actinobacteria bacterium]|nr:MAG: hypothetical protein E6G56_12935 [Actinomycetota bacterium]